ncbi:MAG: hypothetical protein AAB653_02275 [Patescibacteria group bacterium]
MNAFMLYIEFWYEQLLTSGQTLAQYSHDRVETWWGWTRVITFVGVVASFAIFSISVLAGLIWKTGIFVTVSGLLITPMLFITLAYWTPLVVLVGAVAMALKLKFFGIVENGKEYAERWLKIIAAFLLWELIVSFFLSVVPYWNNPAIIPSLGLCAVLMGVMGCVWGRDRWHRTALKTAVVVVFFVNIAFCFFPLCGKAISAKVGTLDKGITMFIKGESDKEPSPVAVAPQQDATTGKVLMIELKPNEIYIVESVYEGQNWKYLSFNGIFYHRVNKKGDGRACWKQVNNNLPWEADCAGKLELKAGNMPVTLIINIL